jgi:hypothetical protein
MKVRANKAMDRYLKELGYDFLNVSYSLPSDLKKIVQSDFVTNNDCIIISGQYAISSNPKLNAELEKCEWENNETHFHTDWNASQYTNDELEYLKLALECAKVLAIRLTENVPDKKFRILVSFSETTYDINNEIDSYGSGTVRFYQIRENAESTFRTEDLNDF